MTISELVLAYWRHVQTYYRDPDGTPGGEQENIRIALRPLRKLFGLSLAADFGPVALKLVRQAMIDAGLARSTINQRVSRVVRLFRWGVEKELVPPSSQHALMALPGLRKGRSKAPEPKGVRPVADAAVEAIRPHCTPQVWAMIELQRLTRARSGEIVLLWSGDIDRSSEVWIYRPRRHKTEHHEHARQVVLGPKAQAVLLPWLQADPDRFLFRPRDAMDRVREERRANRRSPMTPSQAERASRPAKSGRAPGERSDMRAFAHSIARTCDRAYPHLVLSKVPRRRLTPEQAAELLEWRRDHRWHPHQLRHAAATAIRAEYGLEAAQVVLGHAKADVTQVYAERDLAKAVEVMRRLG